MIKLENVMTRCHIPSNSSGSHGKNALLISPHQVLSKTDSVDDFEEIELRLESRFSSLSDALVAELQSVLFSNVGFILT